MSRAREGANEDGEDKALVELKYYGGNFAHQLVKVKL
jgi:hypothetical protein